MTIIQSTLRYHILQCRGRVFIKRCHHQCLVSLKTNIILVFYCLQVVVVAVIVDWDGLPVYCDVYWFFHGWRHLESYLWALKTTKQLTSKVQASYQALQGRW